MMNVCIVGDGLVSLALAKALVNEEIYVDIFYDNQTKKIDKSRTLGISKANVDFLNQNILNIKKLLWGIDKIEIYSDNLTKEKILNFENRTQTLFSVVKNYELYNCLKKNLLKSPFFKKKKNYKNIRCIDYNLIVNCDVNSFFSKKYFYKNINKNYNSCAFTTIIDHKNKNKNNTAVQIFTKKGPIAFLPMSEKKTSVVYSVRDLKKIDFKNIIKKYNFRYEIVKINEISSFKLKASNLRKYHHQNILAFGDLLHKIHPLAGQGFNMTLRDIRLLLDLIKFKINHGLDLDQSIFFDFEKKIKHKNYIFSSGVDFVYELFNFESKINNPILSKSVQFLGKNKYVNKFLTNLANNGLDI